MSDSLVKNDVTLRCANGGLRFEFMAPTLGGQACADRRMADPEFAAHMQRIRDRMVAEGKQQEKWTQRYIWGVTVLTVTVE